MNLQGIVSVSGKPGLWRALTQNKTGYILESLDAQKTKRVANISTSKLAALHEITIFGLDGDIKLDEVFKRMKSASGIPAANADGKELRIFFREVAPGHDEEKVYASDMKKIVNWYHIIKGLPLFNEEGPVTEPALNIEVAEKIDELPDTAKVIEKEQAAVIPKAKKAAVKKN